MVFKDMLKKGDGTEFIIVDIEFDAVPPSIFPIELNRFKDMFKLVARVVLFTHGDYQRFRRDQFKDACPVIIKSEKR